MNPSLSKEELERYQRQMQLPGVGMDGQLKLKNASVLVVGAGGLGCPALIYLAEAGIGTIGIADHDLVAVSNLHRQPLFHHQDVGQGKALIAAQRLRELNPHVLIHTHTEGLLPKNAVEIVDAYDVVLDCTDRFDARYLINDVCVLLNKPFIHGSLLRHQGQLAVFNRKITDAARSATYRCVFPKPPAPSETSDCIVAGIFGFLPGLIGSWMAGEAIKLLLDFPFEPTLLLLDAQGNTLQKMSLLSNPKNGAHAPKTASEILHFDYGVFCSGLT